MAALLDDRGHDRSFVLAALAIGPLLGAPSYFVVGMLLDKIQTPKIIMPFFAGACLALALLSNVSDPRVVMASVALIGICHAASTAIVPYFVSRFFGLRSYSEIYGYSNAMIGGISSIAPILLGLYFDAFHSYQLALTFMTAAFAICTVIAGFLPAYAYRVGRPGDA